MSTRLFGTDGVRGIANRELTPELAFRLGEAAGHFLRRQGRGSHRRRPGHPAERQHARGRTRRGHHLRRRRRADLPASCRRRRSRFLVRELGADGGVVISASHNPPEYNGIKLFSRDGFKLPDDLEDEIESFCLGRARLRASRRARASASVDLVPDAARALHRARGLHRRRRPRGAARRHRLRSRRVVGLEPRGVPPAWRRRHLHQLRLDRHGHQRRLRLDATSARSPRSSGSRASTSASRTTATPTACWRSTRTVTPVDGDQIMAICAVAHGRAGTSCRQRSVVSTVMANLGFEVAMREQGISVVKTKVGDRYVLEQMQAMDANLGGEQSGHIIFLDHNTTGDGLVTALQLAAAVKESRIGARRAHPGDDALPAGARERARWPTRRGSRQAPRSRAPSTPPSRSSATPAACSCARAAPNRSCG